MKVSLVFFLTFCFLCSLVIQECQAFPSLFSLTDLVAERRGSGWLRPWRWLFSRKDEDEEEETVDARSPVANLILSQLQQLQQLPQMQQSMMQPMASTTSVQTQHPMQQLQHHPNALSALDALGPGTFMNFGDDLIYVPFQSLKHFNGISPEWMNLWGNGNANGN